MAYFEEFYNKSIEVYKEQLKDLTDLSSDYNKQWSTPHELTALGFGYEQYSFYFDYAFGDHPIHSFRMNVDYCAHSQDITPDYIEIDEDSDEWPYDQDELEDMENFVTIVAFAKAVTDLILGDSLPIKILDTTRIDIYDDIDDDFDIAEIYFTEKASEEIKKEYIDTFASKEENRNLLHALWDPSKDQKNIPIKDILKKQKTGRDIVSIIKNIAN